MSKSFLLHDLKNKISIVSAMLECSRLGRNLEDEQVNAVFQRIDEILSEFAVMLKTGPVKPRLEHLPVEEFVHFIQFTVIKLSRLYPDVRLSFEPPFIEGSAGLQIAVNKPKLYQLLENAVENSRNALASQVVFTLGMKGSQFLLVLSDDGLGLQGPEKAGTVQRKDSGLGIIQANLKEMSAVGEFSKGPWGGLELAITFTTNQGI